MASGTVLHFGLDQCFRLRVLESAGFAVEDCPSLDDLSAELLREPDAIVLEEEPEGQVIKAIALSRSYPDIPLVLFRSLDPVSEGPASSADLTIPSFTAPELWLREIEDMVERSRMLAAQSRRIRAESAALIQKCAAARRSSQRNRAISRWHRRRFLERNDQ